MARLRRNSWFGHAPRRIGEREHGQRALRALTRHRHDVRKIWNLVRPDTGTPASARFRRYTIGMSSNRNVLLIGFDPHAIPGIDAALVDTAIAIGQKRFEDLGIPADVCLIKPDASAEPEIIAHLQRKDYACVVIGGGIRKPEPLLELFERVINLVRQHAPGAAIAFNTNPTDSADAAMRWLA
jgi:hypothetical protein